MLKDITIGQYFPGESSVHQLDPRIKIILTMLFVILIFMIQSYWGYMIVFAYLVLTTIISGIPYKYLLRGLKPLLYIIIFTFVINVFFSTGTHMLWKWSLITITYEGLDQATHMALRLVFLVLGTSLLTLTTSPISLTDGIEQMLNPLKVFKFPAHELAMMMTIALRFIPTLLEETDKIMKAQMARGADFESGNILQRAKSLVPLLVPLFISAFRRADELAMAMESRCYRGGENRTRMKVLSIEKRDYISILITLIFMMAVIWDGYWR